MREDLEVEQQQIVVINTKMKLQIIFCSDHVFGNEDWKKTMCIFIDGILLF